ncbi:CheF family chemotaxis protein [Pyrococcus sp. ST04]|uniref:CheF family chemotaxis protein n=1 Tax=Pyrococcus sp. ST04 TaxID=1183377 RepID=UPI00064FC2D1|nr:CheF family chemotaxis protein [Pyrococcus sp. ST04]
MAIAETRVKVAIQSSWKSMRGVNWRDAIAQLDSDRLVIKYLKMGEVVSEDSFPFSSLSDISVRIPDELKLNPEKEHFGMKFYIPTRGEVLLILTIEENLLIYDEKKFLEFIHKIFETLINGKPAMIQLARIVGGAINMESKWQQGWLRVVKVKSARTQKTERSVVVITEEKKPISIFSDIEDIEIEEVDMNGKKVRAWKIRHFHINQSVTSYLYIPEKQTQLFVLRYLLKYNPATMEFIMKIADDFPSLKAEFQEFMERELRELEALDEMEKQILVALYSGIDPLELHQFLGITEKEIEEIYDRMIDKGLLKIIMIRKVVDLTNEGRRLVNKLLKYGLVSM